MKRGSWLTLVFSLLVLVAASLWLLRGIGERGVMTREFSLVNRVSGAVRICREEKGRFPANLEEPALQSDGLDSLHEKDWAFLRDCHLTYIV